MKIENIPFTNIDWSTLPPTETKGDTGIATSKEITLGDMRLRLLELSPGYASDHWCRKGHVVVVMDGTLITRLEDGQTHVTTSGNTFVVSDDIEAHRSHTVTGAKVLIVD